MSLARRSPGVARAKPYPWYWADATARTAQAVASAHVGLVGYQADIRLAFQLLSVSPVVWAAQPDPLMFGAPRGWRINVTTAGATLIGLSNGVAGTGTIRTPNTTTVGEGILRIGWVTSATAANWAYHRTGALPLNMPWRAATKVVWTPGASTAARYFAGTCLSTQIAANFDPAAMTACLGIAKLGAAGGNLQFLRNDNSGAAVAVDLGAGFPANTAQIAYELMLAYFGSSQYAINIMNLTTRAEVSYAVSAEVPDGATNNVIGFASNNNTDAVAVSLDTGDLDWNTRGSR